MWTLDQLKSQLNAHARVRGWVIHQETVQRRERYFLMDGPAFSIDQDRSIRQQNVTVQILVRLDGEKGASKQGSVNKKFFKAIPIAEQLESAIAAASQAEQAIWELPKSFPKDLPLVRACDPHMAEDLESVVREMSTQMQECALQKRSARFNSAELFLSVHDRELHLSSGLTHRASQSRIYAEAAFSFERRSPQGEALSDEYMTTRWAVGRDQMDIKDLFSETAERAEISLDTEKPKSGAYSVIVDADVLAVLMNGQVSQLSGANSYHGLPFVKPGSPIVPDARGEKLTLTLDPRREFGADSGVFSEQGIFQDKLELVKDGEVCATSADQQYASYLGIKPTTVRGTVVLSPGKLSHEELVKASPQVLEILQFSGLFADPNTGTFGSEIRLARLHDNRTGKVTTIKGGSLSGSIRDNFKDLKLSRETTLHAHFESAKLNGQSYQGPKYALLNDVSIVGS